MTDKVFLEIKTCKDCPHLGTERYYTADSFEHEENWFCKKTKRPRPETSDRGDPVPESSRIALVSWLSEEPKKIPKWCPLRAKKKKKAKKS